MATRTQIYREALREMDTMRLENAAQLRERKETVYAQVPRLAEIENELSLLGVRAAKLVLQPHINHEEVILKMQAEQKRLEDERVTLLVKNDFSPKMLEAEYSCSACRDTGYIEEERCICLKRRLMDKMYDQSNVRHIMQAENFDVFDLRYYSGEVNPSEGISPRSNAEKAMRRLLRFTSEFDSVQDNILLYGGTGLGKTFLCNSIAKELLMQGKMVLYLTAGQLFKRLEEDRFHRDDEEESKDWNQELLEAELLIIDDLGTEFSTVFTATELFRVINDRKLMGRPVVISTNLSPTELMNHYSDRITSRILGEYQDVHLFGEDIRIIKKYQD